MQIREKIKILPSSSGVYCFLNKEGETIYIGKAKDLKKRVSQYFSSKSSHTSKTKVMVSQIHDIEHIVVNNEADAFLLENNLIKQKQPKYNILLKDDKTYPWICVKKESFPRVFVTRNFRKDGSKYFGPYSSTTHVRNLMELIESIYTLRRCNLNLGADKIAAKKYKVCLNYHIKKCKAPCVGAISSDEYQEQVDAVVEILKGNTGSLIRQYQKIMTQAAAELDFEKAHSYKENINLLEHHYSRSLVSNPNSTPDFDVFNIVFDNLDAFGNFMRIRSGAVVRSMNLHFRARIEETHASLLSYFMREIYERISVYQSEDVYSKVVILPFAPDMEFEGVKIQIPLRGDKLSILELSKKNAFALKLEKLKQEVFVSPQEHQTRILEAVKRDLQMDALPVHIECFDNSNTQGTNPVSACVVFKNAQPSKKDYRHFIVKTVEGPNDYATMREVITRRYTRVLNEGGDLPDLIVVDGGKGQVMIAYEVLYSLGLLDKIKLIGLAERLETIIIPGESYPLVLDKNTSTLKLLMQLRDEAHRFGITHHRKRRSKSALTSTLDEIKGIGEKTQEKLYSHFKTISAMRKASHEDLAKVVGQSNAKKLGEYFADKFKE